MGTRTSPAPMVTVVIPTRDRPGLVCRAVRSALAQSLRDIEVAVVLDGRDTLARRDVALFGAAWVIPAAMQSRLARRFAAVRHAPPGQRLAG